MDRMSGSRRMAFLGRLIEGDGLGSPSYVPTKNPGAFGPRGWMFRSLAPPASGPTLRNNNDVAHDRRRHGNRANGSETHIAKVRHRRMAVNADPTGAIMRKV